MPARSLPCQSRSHIAPRGIAGFLWGLHWLPVQYLQACWAREIRAEASTNLLEQPLLQLLLRMIPDQALVSQNASAVFTVLTHVRTLARVTPAATPVPLPSSPGAAPSPPPQCNRPSAHTHLLPGCHFAVPWWGHLTHKPALGMGIISICPSEQTCQELSQPGPGDCFF